MSFWKIFKKCCGYGDKVTSVYFDLEGMLTDEGEVQEVMKLIPTQKYDDPDFDFYNYFDDPKSDKGENEAKLDEAIQSLTLAYGMKAHRDAPPTRQQVDCHFRLCRHRHREVPRKPRTETIIRRCLRPRSQIQLEGCSPNQDSIPRL
jgi:hypothetical protein